jgi:hypothetical protein
VQKSFSLNNFGVSPFASSPGVGVCEVVLLLSHQRGKNKTKQKNPKFKCSTVSFSPSASSPSSVIVSSKEEKKQNKRVWRQLCECLTETAAHLLPIVSHLLLQNVFITDLWNELYPHLAPQALFI